MTSRRSFLGLAGAVTATALAGCGSDPEIDPSIGPPAEPGLKDQITFGIWDKAQEPAMLQIIDAFNAHYPGISVSISTTAFGPYFERLRIQAQGDDLPDVFWINGPNFELYASYGMLQDLSELEGFDPQNYPPNLVKLYSYEGTPYAIPKDFDTIGLWFNRDLLHRAGVEEPTGSWSWDEYREASEAVTRALGAEQIWGNTGGLANQALIYPLIMQAGGYVLSEDKKTSGYDSPEALEAFRFLDGMIRDGIAPDVRYTAENPPKDLFNNGRAALYPSGNWEAALLQDSPVRDQLGVAPMIHGAEEANVIHGIGCAMSARSRHKPAASVFLAFLGSEEAHRIQAEAGAANPAFLGTNDAYVEAIPEFSLDVFVDAAETALPYPASQNTNAWLQLEELLFPKILGGEESIEDGARELADRMNGVLADES
ncbi:ABC-type sugar transport system, periplasmic component [Brachybacterium faecium DSM 4810]|uniref:ABC-type sugar transport system, periplasmic component n=1 Tax=Brachybacterium faecium (strain ATCC 43885 / DSM 4810 / JCM 11609 / LMG 19847 / NBRC 14762 / NCIMB 9860 / 6-10) TaxID=446465 RepID=C7MI66_BRAFD|nr:sugar ABC transporter substrate-binding protein [Brachybacterium faecium]ACU84492.1 ABC-type sugar transport system, periplasmic component [Brachybacterium faecium DSM 4810]